MVTAFMMFPLLAGEAVLVIMSWRREACSAVATTVT